MRTLVDFDAFISYNREADTVVATMLQRLIRRVGRPWYKPGSLRLFRDRTNLPMSPSLWGSIEDALARSHSFVLLASPQSADSEWVRREVAYWRQYRDTSTFFIVHTGGRIRWDPDARDFDWGQTDALPRELSGWFADEPAWGAASVPVQGRPGRRGGDDQLRDVALTIAASLYGVAKDELHNDDELELRRARRVRRGGIGALVVLLVVALVAAGIAIRKGDEATTQESIALSRRLAAASESQLATNLDLANLLAVRAFRTDPNAETRAALFRAVSTSGSLVRYLPFDADVRALATSPDGAAVAVGLKDGRVLRWRLAERSAAQVFDLDAEVKMLAVSNNGEIVVASDGNTASVARGDAVEAVSVPGAEFRGVAVSASGRTVVLSSDRDMASTLTVLTPNGRSDYPGGDDFSLGPDVLAASDSAVYLLGGGYGFWQRRNVSDWSLAESSRASFGTANYGQTASADGRAFTYTNGAETISVWSTDRPSDIDNPDRTAQAPIASPNAIALSADAASLAVAEDGAIYVSQVLPAGASHSEPVKLSGTGSVTEGTLAFLGASNRKLVSASGNRVALWDLDQTDRISRAFPVSLAAGCNACGPPNIALSPDGSQLIAVDGAGWEGVAGPIAQPADIRPLPDLQLSALYGPAAWFPDGTHAALIVQPQTGGSKTSLPRGMPDYIRALTSTEGSGGIYTAAFTSDVSQMIVVRDDGGIDLIDPVAGSSRTVWPDPAVVVPKAPDITAAAVSSTANLAAVADEESVTVRNALTGAVVGEKKLADVSYLAFVLGRLLVQRRSGALEIWDERLTGVRATLAGDAGFVWPPASNGTLVARARDDGNVVVVDLASGSVLETIPSSGPGRRVGIAFSGDGSRLVTLTESDSDAPAIAVVRDIRDDTMTRAACTMAERELTADEWRALVNASVPEDLRCQ